jgi:hypothetical protein
MKTIQLTQGQVTQVDDEDFEYLNQFKWCANYNSHTKSYYAVRNSPRLFGKRKLISMHRIIMNAPSKMDVDHINHDTLNNQKFNLRTCTRSQNKCNSKKHTDNTSGFKGVTASGKKWLVQIQINNKTTCVGTYLTPEEAARAYDEAAKKYHGEFANLNFHEN